MQSTDRVETQMQTVLNLAAWLHCWLGLSRVTPSARASSSPSGICHYSALCIVQCAFCPLWLRFSDCFETKSKFVNIFSKTVHLGCSPGPPRPFHPLLTIKQQAVSELPGSHLPIREAIPYKLCSFFKHCSKGEGGVKPMFKNFVANILIF